MGESGRESPARFSGRHELPAEARAADASLGAIYLIGGLIAFVLIGIGIAQFASFIAAPPPLGRDALAWFAFFHENWLAGLMGFEVLMVVYMLLSGVLALALFFTLRSVNQPLMVLFLALSFVGIASFINARPAFEMLALSREYAAATTDARKAILLAAGEATLATFDGTSFHISYIVGSLSGLILSFVMLPSGIFSKKTAYARIASSLLDFGLYIPVVGAYISIFSVVFLMVFDVFVGRQLLRLSREWRN